MTTASDRVLVEVFHGTDMTTLFSKSPTDAPLVKVADLFFSTEHEPVLPERVWAACNGHPQSQADAVTSRRYHNGRRSLCVGDVIRVDGNDRCCWQVASLGWDRVDLADYVILKPGDVIVRLDNELRATKKGWVPA